jgi:polysaccharide biosynthesis/export protein
MKSRILLLILIASAAVSCGSAKKFVYLNDMTEGADYPFNAAHEAVIQANDRLSITVSCKQPELAIPFNIQSGSFKVSSDGSASSTQTIDEKGYKVDAKGNIEFPILGTLHIEGKTLSQASKMIKDQIIEGNYIKTPIVTMEFLNFKYTVWGAVAKNGTFSAEDGRINLIEAIANAGDLTDRAKLDGIAVIREVDGNKQIFFHDIRDSKSLLESPCFFLQQNDVIYVQPKYRKKDKEDRGIQYATLLMSTISSISTVIWATSSITK